MCSKATRLRLGAALAAAAALSVPAAPPGFAQVADCVAAVVNERIVTRVDVLIAEAFGLVDLSPDTDPALRSRAVLEKLVDRTVILDFGGGSVPPPRGRIDAALNAIANRLGRAAFEERLAAFGLKPDGLRPYLERKILADGLLESRFSQGPGVSLGEIEAYYAATYAPAEKARGREPKPLSDVLDALGAEIRAAKAGAQAAQWIAGLRRQAEIILRPECLKND